LDGDHDAAAKGFYGVFEQELWRAGQRSSASERRLSAYFQYGQADKEINPFMQHLGAGMTIESPFPLRPHDAMGLAITSVGLSDVEQAGFEAHRESVIEIYYKVHLHSLVSLVPDVQYIRHPGGSRTIGDAIVITPRVAIAF
jgi:porin